MPEDAGPQLPNEDEFFSLLQTYKVTTCFFGHYHGYWRGQRHGVNLVVVGGGGGRLKSWQSEWGKFHHILKVGVDQNLIIEELIALEETFSIEDWLEEKIFKNILPMIQERRWVPYVLFIIFLGSGIYSLFFFVRSLKKI